MEQIYKNKLNLLGYTQLVCDIFPTWEDVKDEILVPERKSGTGNGTIHVFLGAADNELRKEFASYYRAVNSGEDPAVGAIEVKHYFLASNVLSMIGYVCQYYYSKGQNSNDQVRTILSLLSSYPSENGLLETFSFFKLSTGSSRLRPYFKQFESDGVFTKLIRQLLLPNSYYKISLYKNANGGYAAFWLIGFDWQTDFEANSNKDLFSDNKAREVFSALLQRIFYGAPGTGKSNTIKREVDDKNKVNYRVTFHPDSDYSTFVGTYKPSMKPTGVTLASGEKEEVITYKFVPQAFTKAYTAAWNTADDVYLIIEEINRGNCAQIFGDLFQLLDRGSDGFSEYPVDADSDLADYIHKKLEKSSRTDFPNGVKDGKKLVLPSNLYIWATMNTSDQSLFPIDSAFKRRWDWQYMPIADGNKNWRIEVNGLLYDWWDFLEKINTQIGLTTNSEDKKLGYYFCKANDKLIDAKTFVGKVIFYLWNDVFKDYDLEGDLFKDDDNSKLTFDKFYAVQNSNTIINESKVELFLKNLGVEPLEEVIDDEDVDDESNEMNSQRKSSNIEIYYDGSKIDGKNSIVKFANLIEMIGVEKVAELGIIAIKKSSIALLSKNKLPEDTPGGYGKGMRQIGDYWMVVKYSNPTKISMINEIAGKLSLNIRAELIQ